MGPTRGSRGSAVFVPIKRVVYLQPLLLTKTGNLGGKQDSVGMSPSTSTLMLLKLGPVNSDAPLSSVLVCPLAGFVGI